jgi:hypothetical protein
VEKATVRFVGRSYFLGNNAADRARPRRGTWNLEREGATMTYLPV